MRKHAEIFLGMAESVAAADELIEGAKAEATELINMLEGIAVDVSFKTSGSGRVVMSFDWEEERLKTLKTRNAGRRLIQSGWDSPLCEMTLAEALEWLSEHGEREGRDALGGVSRATFYRRRAQLALLAEQCPDRMYYDLDISTPREKR